MYIYCKKKEKMQRIIKSQMVATIFNIITTVIQKTKINLHYNRCTVVVKNNKKNNMFPILAV